jgi:antitoxin ParD1/3/4
MNTIKISLPDSLKMFVEEQVSHRSYGSSSAYVCDLLRKDQGRQQLHTLLLAGASSKPTPPSTTAYFDGLRDKVRKTTKLHSLR